MLRNSGTYPNLFRGCTYKSLVDLNHHAYYLLNDKIELPVIPDPTSIGSKRRKRRDLQDPSLPFIQFPYLEIISYHTQGNFQCVLYDLERMSAPVKSEKTLIILPGKLFLNYYYF